MKRVGLYVGSFDPITNGHLDIIKRSLSLFDEVIVAIGHNPAKKGFFNVEERKKLIRTAYIVPALPPGEENPVRVVDYEDRLTTEFAKEVGATALIRGLRALTDFEYELQFEHVCRSYEPDLQVVYLMTAPEHSYVSSSLVRQLSSLGAPVDKFVPWCVVEALQEKCCQEDSIGPKELYGHNPYDPDGLNEGTTDVEVPVPHPTVKTDKRVCGYCGYEEGEPNKVHDDGKGCDFCDSRRG